MSLLGGEASRIAQKEIAGLTDRPMVNLWLSALSNPNPEAAACVIAAAAREGEVEDEVDDVEDFEGRDACRGLDEVARDVERKLEDMAREIMFAIASMGSPGGSRPGVEERLAAINAILFNRFQMGLPNVERTAEAMGASYTIYRPDHYRIDKALDSMQADPFLLSILYMALARRVGVDVTPVYITQLPTKILLRAESENGAIYYIDTARNGTTFERETVLRDLEAGVRSVAEREAARTPTSAAAAGWLPSPAANGGRPTGPLRLPGVDGEGGVAPLGRVLGQMLMALANACVIRGEPREGVRWKRVARALQEAVDIIEVKDLGL